MQPLSLKQSYQPDPILNKGSSGLKLNVNPMFEGNQNLGLPNLELNKSASSYKYASKKARKQHWLSHFK